MQIKRRIIFLVILLSALIYLFATIYDNVKKNVIRSFNEYQMLLAKQASLGIEQFFENLEHGLIHLSKDDNIIMIDEKSPGLMDSFLKYYPRGEVSALTRVDAQGNIIYTTPYNKNAEDANIADQEHFNIVSNTLKPVISDVFMSVQGYETIAIHVPIIKNGEFLGTIAFLTPFNVVAKKFLEPLQFDDQRFSLTISEKGRLLCCPDQNRGNCKVYSSLKNNASGKEIISKMSEGYSGVGSFYMNTPNGKKLYHAVYCPVKLDNTHWSILIASREEYIVSDLAGLRNRLLFIVAVFFISGIIYLFSMAKAWNVISLERKRSIAEKEIIKYKNLLDNVIDSMPSVLIGVDKVGKVILWNTGAENHSGIKEEDALGRDLVFVYPDLNDELDIIYYAINKAELKKYEKIAKDSKGEAVYNEITIFPLIAKNIKGAVIRIEDITEQKKVKDVVAKSEKMISIGGLAAGMAHEINNPLGGMIQNIQVVLNRLKGGLAQNENAAKECGFSMDALEKYLAKREIFEIISSILNSGERASKIIDNMLSFSRTGQIAYEKINMNELLDRTLDLTHNDYHLKTKYGIRDIEIIKEYAADLKDAECERNTMQQVLFNIIKNSAHALFDKGMEKGNKKIILRTYNDKDMVTLEVEDNGKGIAAQDLPRIFEPFYTTKEVGKGTGLGLFVAYFIVKERHNGTIEVLSEKGKFTKMIIKIPADRNDYGS